MTLAVRVATAALAAVIGVAILRGAFEAPARTDLIAQYAAATLVARGDGPAIVDPDAVLRVEREAAPERVRLLPFVQPPAVALLLSPLAGLPFAAAHALVALVNAALILAAVVALTRSARAPAIAAAVLALGPPAVVAVAQAQTSPLVLALVALAVRASARPAGVALGLALLRPQTAPLLLLAGALDPARRWWTALGGALVIVASFLVVGADGILRYARTLATASTWSVSGEHGLATAIGWSGLASSLGVGVLGIVLPVVSLAAGAVAVVRAPRDDRVVVASTWSLLASPHTLMHDAVLACPAAIALASRRAPWDAASVLAWLAHLLVAPLGVLWSAVLALRTLGYARHAR